MKDSDSEAVTFPGEPKNKKHAVEDSDTDDVTFPNGPKCSPKRRLITEDSSSDAVTFPKDVRPLTIEDDEEFVVFFPKRPPQARRPCQVLDIGLRSGTRIPANQGQTPAKRKPAPVPVTRNTGPSGEQSGKPIRLGTLQKPLS